MPRALSSIGRATEYLPLWKMTTASKNTQNTGDIFKRGNGYKSATTVDACLCTKHLQKQIFEKHRDRTSSGVNVDSRNKDNHHYHYRHHYHRPYHNHHNHHQTTAPNSSAVAERSSRRNSGNLLNRHPVDFKNGSKIQSNHPGVERVISASHV